MNNTPGQPSQKRTILVTGATGYIASRLIPLLLQAGYPVRCLARNPDRLKSRAWYPKIEVIAADVTRPETLPEAMQDVRAAYYLIHSMAAGHGYDRLDRVAARNFAQAARDAGVEHILYVGGLADPGDPQLALHLKSRLDSGDALREAGLPVTEFRAGVIVGPGSVSFEMIRFIAEQFPLMIGPLWLRHRSQPIATPDILAYLIAALETPASRGRIIELGCQTSRTYIDIMSEYARIRGLKRIALLLPFIPPALMAIMIDKLTPVEYSYALPLVEGLQNDSLILDPLPSACFPPSNPWITLKPFAAQLPKPTPPTPNACGSTSTETPSGRGTKACSLTTGAPSVHSGNWNCPGNPTRITTRLKSKPATSCASRPARLPGAKAGWSGN